MEGLVRINGTDYSVGNFTLTASYVTYSVNLVTNPATGAAWTASEVNGLEAGMRAINSNPGGRVAQVYAVVVYT